MTGGRWTLNDVLRSRRPVATQPKFKTKVQRPKSLITHHSSLFPVYGSRFTVFPLIIPIMQNKEILFAIRPTGMPTLETFKIVETEVPQLKDGRGVGAFALPFSRSVPARPHARRQIVRRSVPARRGHQRAV